MSTRGERMSVADPSGVKMNLERMPHLGPAEIDRAKALGMLRMKRQGVPVNLIARHYRCSRVTVWRWIKAIPLEARCLA